MTEETLLEAGLLAGGVENTEYLGDCLFNSRGLRRGDLKLRLLNRD